MTPSLGLTLKHIILTGADDDILTEASPEGYGLSEQVEPNVWTLITRKLNMFNLCDDSHNAIIFNLYQITDFH